MMIKMVMPLLILALKSSIINVKQASTITMNSGQKIKVSCTMVDRFMVKVNNMLSNRVPF